MLFLRLVHAGLFCVAPLLGGYVLADETSSPAAEVGTEADAAEHRLTTMLVNMPTNSDKRCVGIAGVAETLLDGKTLDEEAPAEEIERLAERIFVSFRTGSVVSYPSHVTIAGKPTPITDPAALNPLVTAVADVYKQSHSRLIEDQQGVAQLLAAENQRVMTLQDLDRLLAAEADQLDFFCCFGRRRFPDGSEAQTSHAVLMQRQAGQSPVVYDPNDPGTPQQAIYRETEQGLEVEWTCPYRATGLTTTQRYHIVPKGRFFQTAAGQAESATSAADPPAGDH